MNGQDAPGVLVRPPLMFLGALAVGWGLSFVLPPPFILGGWRFAAGAAALMLGIGLMAGAIRRLALAGTPLRTSEAVTALVTGGLYRLSRNPIYLGLIANYTGLALLIGAPWALVLLIPVLIVLRFGVIAREERYLERKFGEDYRSYKIRVGRWLGPL